MTLEGWLESIDRTNADVARDLGTSRQLVHCWVTGKQKPGLFWALRLEVYSNGKVPVEVWLSREEREQLDKLTQEPA
jgi:hypothetical protein